MRITVTLDDEVHERLVDWAKADRRSVGGTAAMLIEFALDPTKGITVPEGVPGHGVRVPEPKPSKQPPPTGGAINPRDCVHPKSHHKILSWGTLCELCGGRVTR